MKIHVCSEKKKNHGDVCVGLEAARKAARKLIADGLTEPLVIELAAGTYQLTEPLVLDINDGGTENCPVTWLGPTEGEAILSVGVPVEEWQNCETLPKGVPQLAAGKVYCAPLPEGIHYPRVIFDEEGILMRAESEGIEAPVQKGVTNAETLCFEPGCLPAAVRPDMELFLKPSHPWVINMLPIRSVDEKNGVIRTEIPGTYPLTSHLGWQTTAPSCYLQNVPEGMTEPGRWFVDRESRILFLWPRNEGAPQGILIPAATEVLRVEGDLEERRWPRNLHFKQLTFSHADMQRWPSARVSIQHDWELYEGATACLRLRNTEAITVSHCTFRDSGGGGIRSEQHGVDQRIHHNSFLHLGGSGIALVGVPPGNRDEHHHNEVSANRIEAVGELIWHASGIILCQTGHNQVGDNLLFHLPYNAITLVSGREGIYGEAPVEKTSISHDGQPGCVAWDSLSDCPARTINRIGFLTCRYNRIEHNEIHHCMERLGDGNGIYISGTGVGNIVRRNWVHDITGAGCQSSIRFDDHQWHCHVEENVIARIEGGGITVKDVNDVENNIVVHCTSYGSILVRRKDSWGSNIRRNILVQSGAPFAEGKGGINPPFYDGNGYGGRLEEPTIEDNLLWCTQEKAAGEMCMERMQGLGKDTRSIFADPQFIDAENDNYQLHPDSPALTVGFRPFSNWGCRETPGATPRT